MLKLRLSQSSLPDDRYRIELCLEGDNIAPQSASADVQCEFSDRDRDDIRWYLETYPQYPIAPNPEIAARVEQRMEEIGATLFRSLFQANDDARDLWATLRAELKDTRVEISTGVEGANALPWELLRDPKTDIPLALSAQTFARAQSKTAQRPQLPKLGADEPIRILLVICRPGRDDDVPFRSVALRLLEGLTEEQRAAYTLDVLRPPTYDRLAETLRRAKDEGKPYHVVHFDGHGAYVENTNGTGGGWSPSRQYFSDTRSGQHGYLVFEKPAVKENSEFVSGPKLGALLYETGVPVLVLNACRSAHAETLTPAPPPSLTPSPDGGGAGVGESADIHEQVRAFGSLAQEVVDAGVAGVIAMRYNVFVVTAARFVGELYGALARGQDLGRAATYGRKRLHDDPQRDVVEPITLQDWSVPVIYEAAPIRLFPAREAASLHVALGAALRAPQSGLDPNLPPPPDAGFFGRDETLLALDRAFDTENVVLLHGYAGSGKTATAAEFARWYAATGGLRLPNGLTGPVLFTSFEQYLPLPRALDQFGAIFDATLQANNIHWLALSDAERAQVALMLLQQVPVLWIWDNVEPVTGFPAGSETPWSIPEQAALADFLRACRGTKARVVLTSRRDEHDWLGEFPRRIDLPPMPRRERVQLARALARKHGRALEPLRAWEPLLLYTDGNPLALTVVVGQALRDGLHTEKQIADYVARLRNGEDAFPDEQSEGRSRSLGASLAYGFDAAFTDAERRVLALLYLFQGFVDVDVLRYMENNLLDLYDFWRDTSRSEDDRRQIRAHLIALLDKASEIGLLTAHGGGYYTIHPALPWFFRRFFEQFYSPESDNPQSGSLEMITRLSDCQATRLHAERAFVDSIGELGVYYFWQYQDGNRDVIDTLRAEEANLLRTWRLAYAHGWWHRVMSVMHGLSILYDHTGRRAEWRALVEAVEPESVDPATGGPLPGREEQWSLIRSYRVRLAQDVRDWAGAERIQRAQVAWQRQQAALLLAGSDDLTGNYTVRSLAASLHELSNIQREQGKTECVRIYEESLRLFERIGERTGAATCAFSLGRVYGGNVPALRELNTAEHWYKHSLKLHAEEDQLGQGRCYNQLGYVAWERFKEVRKRISESANERMDEAAERELLEYLNEALRYYRQALELLPVDAVDDLAVVYHQLGTICQEAGDVARAVQYYNEAVRYDEAQGNFYGAGLTHYNLSLMLAQRVRFADALAYARAALRDFQQYQGRAEENEEDTQRLIALIERAMAADKNADHE